MRDLEYFMNESCNRGLCDDYTDRWIEAKSKQELFDFAMKFNSVRYLATSIYEGWGLGVDYIKSEFSEFINGAGRSIEPMQGSDLVIKGEMYIDYCDTICVDTDVTTIIQCNGAEVNVKKGCCQLHISNNSDVRIKLPTLGTHHIYLYDNSIVDLGAISEEQKVVVYIYGDTPTQGRINYMDDGGSVSIRRRNLSIDAFGVTHNNI